MSIDVLIVLTIFLFIMRTAVILYTPSAREIGPRAGCAPETENKILSKFKWGVESSIG